MLSAATKSWTPRYCESLPRIGTSPSVEILHKKIDRKLSAQLTVHSLTHGGLRPWLVGVFVTITVDQDQPFFIFRFQFSYLATK